MNKQNIYYSAVYFDLDSTLVDIEGIDELANFYGKKEEVAALTKKSMSGQVKLEEVFALKLAIIRPKKEDFDKLGKLYIEHVVEDAKETIELLQTLNKSVMIMTGNFYPAVEPLANYLHIPLQNVFANQISFDQNGQYSSFDVKGPLSVAGGKRSVMLILKREKNKVVFVGDGSTDAETKPPVDLFIGYAGVIKRENVIKEADAIIECKSMAAIIPYILTADEIKRVDETKYKTLLKRAQLLVK